MSTKVRKQIYLEAEQDERLKAMAAQTGASEAEIIRDALDRHAGGPQAGRRDLRAWAEERAFIAGRMAGGPVPGQRTWQREDLHER